MKSVEEWDRMFPHRENVAACAEFIRAIQRDALESAAKVCGDSGDYYIEQAEGWLKGWGIPRLLGEKEES